MAKIPFTKDDYKNWFEAKFRPLVTPGMNQPMPLNQSAGPGRTVVDNLLQLNQLSQTKPYTVANTARN